MSVGESDSADVGSSPLIETKLLLPRPRAEFIDRPRLMQTLDESWATPLALIVAPLGFGKTVLVQSWCAEAGTAVAWVSLDQTDDDPVRFWMYVATAVDRVRRGLASRALARLRHPGVAIDDVVADLLNGVAAYRDPIAIVLDDLQTISNSTVLDSVMHMIGHLPRNARVIATTRFDPVLPLGRLRGQGRLAELRSADLAFTVTEASELLGRAGLRLDDRDVGLLVERMEGWPAAVYLALLWLRQHDDPHAGIRSFSADHRHVAAYLTEEVLDHLDPDRLSFLTRTSILPRFTAPLCDVLLGRADSAGVIAEIERSNLFLIPLDPQGQWFRYHHLFAELLRLRLAASEPDAAAALHRRASAWFLERDLVDEAVLHAFAAGDENAVAALLAERHQSLMRRADLATFLGWVQRLSADALRPHPELAASAALAAGVSGSPTHERRRLLALAESGNRSGERPRDPYVESLIGVARATWMDGDAGRAVENAQRAVEAARRSRDEFAVAALASLAQSLYLSGDLDAAAASAGEAARMPAAPEDPYAYMGALAMLAIVDAERGRARSAELNAERAAGTMRDLGVSSSWIGGLVHLALAAAMAAKGDHRSAERYAARAVELEAGEPDLPHAQALLTLAEARIRRGLLGAAAIDLERAREEISGFADAGRLDVLLGRLDGELAEARAQVAGGAVYESPSEAELRVLRLLASDLSLREIGAKLFISVNTVRTHVRELYRKLNVNSRHDAVVRASTLGLIDE